MDAILRRLRESRLQEANKSYEYVFRIPWRESMSTDDDEMYHYDTHYMDYAADIMSIAEEDFNDIDWTKYTSNDTRTESSEIKSMKMSFNGDGDCFITVVTGRKLDQDEIAGVMSYLEGQMSDGWGEGFEQREIARGVDYDEQWIDDDEDEDGGYYEEVEIPLYYYGQFWWSGDPNHGWDIDLVSSASDKTEETDESLEESNDSEYYRLKKTYPKSASFKDIDKESGSIRDLTDELDHKGISYEIYKDKTDKGCTVFYENAETMSER